MVNLWGPGAFFCARPAATRPELTPLNGAGDPDDWLKDCSSIEARDGTELRAGLLNALLAQLRGLVRKSDQTDSNLDDTLVAKAIRSQRLNFVAAVGGTANALTVTLDPVLTAHQPGLVLRIFPSATNTAAVTLNAGAGALPLRYVNGADLFPGEIVPGRTIEVLCLGGVWVLLNPVEYFERLTPKRARQTSAFTPNVVLSDIGGVNSANLTQSVTITGVTYLDCTAYCAIRNTTGTLAGTIAYLRLVRSGFPNVDSQYLGCQSINNTQIPLSIRALYKGLDPSATYIVQLLTQKDASVGPIGVLDAYLQLTSD